MDEMCIDIMDTLNSSRGMRCYGLFTPYEQLLGLFLLLLLYTIVCCSYISRVVTEEDYDYGSAIITPLILPTVFFLAMCFIGSRVNTFDLIWFDLLCLTPVSAIFQQYHGDQS
jgi:hypothetical protein